MPLPRQGGTAGASGELPTLPPRFQRSEREAASTLRHRNLVMKGRSAEMKTTVSAAVPIFHLAAPRRIPGPGVRAAAGTL